MLLATSSAFGSAAGIAASRNVWAMFTEANVPILKTLEGNVAVRFDHYSDFGSTTNPKLSIRWQPTRAMLVRASIGTGFRAPGLIGIYEPPAISPDPAKAIQSDVPSLNHRTTATCSFR